MLCNESANKSIRGSAVAATTRNSDKRVPERTQTIKPMLMVMASTVRAIRIILLPDYIGDFLVAK